MRRRIRQLSLFLFSILLALAVARPALAYYSTDKVWWARFETACENCTPTQTIPTWPSSSSNGLPHMLGIVQGTPYCDGRWFEVDSKGNNNTATGNYEVIVTLDLDDSQGFCGGADVHWRLYWSHE